MSQTQEICIRRLLFIAYFNSASFSGRARSWSEKQRRQNLWTKKGYDLIFRACFCKCKHGHLKKDLDWAPQASSSGM